MERTGKVDEMINLIAEIEKSRWSKKTGPNMKPDPKSIEAVRRQVLELTKPLTDLEAYQVTLILPRKIIFRNSSTITRKFNSVNGEIYYEL